MFFIFYCRRKTIQNKLNEAAESKAITIVPPKGAKGTSASESG